MCRLKEGLWVASGLVLSPRPWKWGELTTSREGSRQPAGRGGMCGGGDKQSVLRGCEGNWEGRVLC